jgi:hypothetical protein
MTDPIKELARYKLDPSNLNLENLTRHLPHEFKSQYNLTWYKWVAAPVFKGWGIAVYLCTGEGLKLHREFISDSLENAICLMLLWLLQNDIVSYHQLIELL